MSNKIETYKERKKRNSKDYRERLKLDDFFTPQHNDRWSRQEAYNYYVKRTKKVTIQQMVALSDVSRSTLSDWSRYDNWVQDRSIFHREIPEKWTIEQARDHYIQSEKHVPLRELNELSGISVSTLGKYSSQEKWGEQRKEHQYKARKSADDEYARLQGQKRAERNHKIAKNLFNGHQAFADVSMLWLENKRSKLVEALKAKDDETVDVELRGLVVDEVNKWSNIYARHAKLAMETYGVAFTVNHDAAIALLDKEGFAIREKQYLLNIERRIASLGNESDLPDDEDLDIGNDSDDYSKIFAEELSNDTAELPGSAV